MPKMKMTIAKILHAQISMTAAKLSSASRPLPRLLRKSRIGDSVAPTASCTVAAEGVVRGDGAGDGDLDSRSGVIRVEDTISFPDGLTLRIDCNGLKTLNRNKGQERGRTEFESTNPCGSWTT